MAPRTSSSSSLALFLCLNLVLFATTSAHGGDSGGSGDNCHTCGPSTPTTPTTPTSPTTPTKCPVDTLKLGVCTNLLETLLRLKLGDPPVKPCCSLISNLADLEAALCLCSAIRGSLLGIKLDVPVSLSVLLNACDKKAPSGFTCPTN